jgi:hypothetical protein
MMKFSDWFHAIALSSSPSALVRPLAMIGVFGLAVSAPGQSVSTVVSAPDAPPPNLQSSPAPGLTTPAIAPLQWGIVGVYPHAFYRVTRSDGIQTRPGQQTTTTISTASAGLRFGIGRRWTADYTPTWTMYSSPSFRDTVDHRVSINGQASFTDGDLSFSQRYTIDNSPRIETGRQTREEISMTSLSSNYRLGQRSRLEVSLRQELRYIESAPNSYQWTMRDWYHYQVSNRVDAAIGVAVGYVAVEPGTDMVFTRPEARVGWRPTNKLGFDVHAGAENRRFRKSGAARLNSPTYGASAFYQPFPFTTLSLSGERDVRASYFAGAVNQRTSWSLGLNQRLLQRFNFNAAASRGNTRYIPAGQSVIVVVREDTSNTYSFRLSTSFLRRGTAGVVYQRTRNESDAAAFAFSSDQYGLEIGYSY